MSCYTYDSSTGTLVITGPTGYAEVMSSDLILEDIRILKDRSAQPIDKEKLKVDAGSAAEVRADRTFQSYSPPADFPLLPNLREAHFTGVLLQPPRFPLPPKCKLYAYIEARLWGVLGRRCWQYDPDYFLVDPLDDVFPWFEMPGLTMLQLRHFKHSTGPPPACDSLEHLFLWDCNSFVLPQGSKLSQNLKTFVLEYFNGDMSDRDMDETFDGDALFAALPNHSLETLVIGHRNYCCTFHERERRPCETLANFTKLTTLCVWRSLFVQENSLWYIVPASVQTLILNYGDMAVELATEETEQDITVYLDKWADNLYRLVIFKTSLWDDEEKIIEPAIANMCLERGIDFTLTNDKHPDDAYNYEAVGKLELDFFKEEMEAGCVYPHVELEMVPEGEYLPSPRLSLKFKDYPAYLPPLDE